MRPRCRFSLRSLLCWTAWVAILLALVTQARLAVSLGTYQAIDGSGRRIVFYSIDLDCFNRPVFRRDRPAQ